MKNKYYNEAIIGNKKMLLSFSKKGELLRLFYPSRDYKQFVDEMLVGLKINDSRLVYLHEDINNQYEQYYTENTNILNTNILNTYFNISIKQTDIVSVNENILIKRYKIKNENIIDLDIKFLVYSNLLSDFNDMVGSKIENNILMQYNHKYTYCIFSNMNIASYRLNNSKEEIKTGEIKDKDYIGMAKDSAISYEIGILKPSQEKEIDIYVYINDNDKKNEIDEIVEDIEKIKKIDIEKEEIKTKTYWEKYVKEHDGLKLLQNKEKLEEIIKKEDEQKDYEKLIKIYIRTILLFPLLVNEETGGISAAVEIDEERKKCGRYSYCWPRDAVFITKALDILNMEEITTKFYTKFAKNTQNKNGMWEQRFYTDGRLAPCWGYQIDETASIIYGVYEHYKKIKDKEFLKQTYSMCKNGINALEEYLNAINILEDISKQITIKNFETIDNYDLWEMNEGIHLYSLASIYAAFNAMVEIEKQIKINKDNKNTKIKEEEIKNKENIEKYKKIMEQIKKYCLEKFVNKSDNTLRRNNKDDICDISILGTINPFKMFEKDDKIITNTINKIEMKLRTYTGGYLRFENDSYLEGNNPWLISTLWMALYNIENNEIKEAIKKIELVEKTATTHGLLAEQIDNKTMEPKWVIGLGWSHAMYIITLGLLWGRLLK